MSIAKNIKSKTTSPHKGDVAKKRQLDVSGEALTVAAFFVYEVKYG